MERFGKKLRTVFFVKTFVGAALVSKSFRGKDALPKAQAYAAGLSTKAYLFRRSTYAFASVETQIHFDQEVRA